MNHKSEIEGILDAAEGFVGKGADLDGLGWQLIKTAAGRMGFYAITARFNEDHTFAEIPEMPGCMTCGENYEHTWRMLIDAAIGWLRVELEDM